MAQELGKYNITVNAVCPGAVDNRMTRSDMDQASKILGVTVQDLLNQLAKDTPLGTLSREEDSIGVTLFLCSDPAEFITGEAINVTDGLEMH
jgi:NAD(P)-dependent dehydrogenase (short-subunit alcohol dehydrogenase family)